MVGSTSMAKCKALMGSAVKRLIAVGATEKVTKQTVSPREAQSLHAAINSRQQNSNLTIMCLNLQFSSYRQISYPKMRK